MLAQTGQHNGQESLFTSCLRARVEWGSKLLHEGPIGLQVEVRCGGEPPGRGGLRRGAAAEEA